MPETSEPSALADASTVLAFLKEKKQHLVNIDWLIQKVSQLK